ncbi:MAG: hypothetical protein ACPGRC_00790 [Salibacteraceae bacterium]
MISNWGVHPTFGIIALTTCFIGVSELLFINTEYAHFIYVILGLFSVWSLHETKRNNFLNMVFSNKDYQIIRVIESLVFTLPFCLFLIYKHLFVELLTVNVGAVLLTFLPSHKTLTPMIKTPFGKFPFEFTIGFRKWFWAYPIPAFLVYKGVEVGNFNLSVFGMELLLVISMFFYFNPEPTFYVWVHKDRPQLFLLKKVGIAIWYTSSLVFPFTIFIALNFSGNLVQLFLFLLLGFAYLVTVILAKYASFPKSISLPQAIVLGLSLYYPLIIVGVIPFLFVFASRKLNPLLK